MDTALPVTDAAGDEDAFAIALPPRPYPGLRPFDENEWPIFFGRERMVDAVVTRLVQGRLVVAHGDSGSGKSSLIRAGVLPRLRQEQARGGARWRTCIMLPRGGPLRRMAAALAAIDGREGDAERLLALRRALNLGRRAPAALADLMLVDEHDHLCILIDQFEELFEHARTQPGGESEARCLTDALVALAESPPRGLYVALTMRSEYLGACARFPGLAEAVNAHQYLLPPMATADLLRAIREPAALYGGEVEPVLAERLAADALGPDGLPLVQHALMLMRRDAGAGERWRLTRADYPADGLGAMLSRHATQVADAAQPARHPRLVEDLMRALTTINAEGHAVRRPQPLAALAAVCGVDGATLTPVVDALRAEGVSFLTPRGSAPLADDDWVDIGHEALIRCWTTLADPVDGWLQREFRNGLVWRSLLVQADSYERDPANVLSAATSEERLQWLRRRTAAWAERYGGGWDRVQRLVQASETRRIEDERLHESERAARRDAATARRRLFAAIGVGLGALALAATAAWQWYQAEGAKDAAESAQAQAEHAKDTSESAQKDNARLLEQAQTLIDTTRKALDEASTQARTPAERATLARLQNQIRSIGSQVETEQLAAAAPASTDPLPRVYVHIGAPEQKTAAETFVGLLGKQRLAGRAINAPGVQLVTGQRNDGVLRCFRVDECRDEAPALLATANELLASPKLALQDLSSRYASNPPRAHHFEVWFGNASVQLAGPWQSAPAASR